MSFYAIFKIQLKALFNAQEFMKNVHDNPKLVKSIPFYKQFCPKFFEYFELLLELIHGLKNFTHVGRILNEYLKVVVTPLTYKFVLFLNLKNFTLSFV